MENMIDCEKEVLEKIVMIDPARDCLKFLRNRVESNNYRGMQISQHNRYTAEDVKIILKVLNESLGQDKYMQIRDTDLSKRPINIKGEESYAKFVNEVNKARPNNRGTQDSIRKNYFVDFHRMGFIERYDKYKRVLDPYKSAHVKYVGITELGKRFISENNIINEKIIFATAIDTLMQGKLNEILELMYTNDFQYVSENEFMYFLSFLGESIGDCYYNTSTLKEYIKEYRTMSRLQKAALDQYLIAYCNPDNNVDKDKTYKRDYHNWKNETQQIFFLLNQTPYFEVIDGKLSIRIKDNPLTSQSKKGYKRSVTAKKEYFKKHELQTQKGYELHHIISLGSAKSLNELTVFDVWQNLLYIDGMTHNKISQTKNENIVLSNNREDLILSKVTGGDNIYCKSGENVLYKVTNQPIMINYNKTLLNDTSCQ